MAERTGLVAFWKGYDRSSVLRYAQIADELGYDSFWVPEAWGYEAFSLLTEIAIATKRIKIATGIVNVFSRSPGLMAMHAATLDEISGGRLILGLGTSGAKVIEGFHAVPYKKPLTRLRQYVKVVQTLVAGGKISDAGADLWPELRPFKLEMTPVRARIPIYCACLNEEAIRMVGELADGWMPTFWPYTRLGEGRKLLAEGAARARRNADEVVTKDEVPRQMLLYLTFAGVTTKEKMGREEFKEFYKEMRKRLDGDRGRRPGRGPDGGEKPEAKKGP